ncbi:MAG: glycosyltransferase [Flavobacteriales bacterium]|nr:glycosyltransferase [Flavobacteriales bacterium]
MDHSARHGRSAAAFDPSFAAMQAEPMRVLVVGQTPPPFGGQAVMIEKFLEGAFTTLELAHVRLAYSEEMSEVGRFSLKKVRVLFRTIAAVWAARIKHRSQVLYYPPSGPNLVPILRDIIFLIAVRWCFRYTVFHFHAGGLSTYMSRLPAPIRWLAWLAYRKPDLAIRTSDLAPPDAQHFKAKRIVSVFNGIEDLAGGPIARDPDPGRPMRILFTAVLIPSKGVEVLVQSFIELIQRGVHAELMLMGRWGDAAFEQRMLDLIAQHGLRDRVRVLGVRTGNDKLNDFRAADVFCFPSHFEAESFPVVLMEAAQFALPVVATDWRGIPVMVDEGVNGFLVPTHDPMAVADRLERLAKDPELRHRMALEARRVFADRFTLAAFHRNMESAFAQLKR